MIDYQMLKELKKKLDTDNDKKKSLGLSNRNELFTNKSNIATPKTFSPDHKPITQKINQNNTEFLKNNANSISSKINYVNLDSFLEFKGKINKVNYNQTKEYDNRPRGFSYHKKNPSESRFSQNSPLKKSTANETNSTNYNVLNNNKALKKTEISQFQKTENNSLGNSDNLISYEEKPSIFHLENDEETNKNIKKNSHKRTASYGCNPFSFFDSKTLGSEIKLNEKSDIFSDNKMLFHMKSQKTLSLRYVTKTKKGFLKGNTQKCNQDSFISVPNFGRNIQNYLFAVCDGHGTYGHLVSNFLKEHLPKFLLEDTTFNVDPQKSIFNVIAHTEKVLENSFIDTSLSGSTLIAILILNNSIISCNVGDSRSILARKLMDSWNFKSLSYDHKPEIISEKERIIQQGGRIDYLLDNDGQPVGPLRVWLNNEFNYGIAMTRSIGDKTAKAVGVTWEPDIRCFQIEEEDKFIVIASDGLWEVINNQECVDFLGQYYEKQDLEGAAEFLMAEANNRWNSIEKNAIDDITFIIIFFNRY